MSNSLNDAIKEASNKAGEFIEELIKIADKAELNRTEFIRCNARTFLAIALGRSFEKYKKIESEETNNE